MSSNNTQTKITLFDIATTLPNNQPISPFCARMHYVLNYKQLPYTSVLVKFKDIEAISKEHGFAPTGVHADGSLRYTLPALLDETSGKRVALSDSGPAIQYLDTTYPDPSRPLFPSLGAPAPAVHMLADAYLFDLVFKIRPLFVRGLLEAITPESRATWRANTIGGRTIEEDELKKGTKEYGEALGSFLESLKAVAGMLEKNGPGVKWIMGNQPTFIDFSLLSLLRLVMLSSAEVWEEIKAVEGGVFDKYMKAGEVYFGRG